MTAEAMAAAAGPAHNHKQLHPIDCPTDDNNNHTHSICDLPVELLTHVLAHVPVVERIRVERVCRRLQRAALNTWNRHTCHSITVHHQQVLSSDDLSYLASPFATVAILKRGGPYVRHLQIGCVQEERALTPHQFIGRKFELQRVVMAAVVEHCTRLQSLVLSRHVITGIGCLALFTRLPPELTRLSIINCRLDACNEADGVSAELLLRQLWQALPNLQTFELVGRGSCYGYLKLYSSTFDLVPSTIEHLDISSGQSTQLADLLFVKRMPNLRWLSLQRSEVDSAALGMLCTCCPRLHHLDLSYSRRITDFTSIAQLPDLSSLVLDGNRDYLTDRQLRVICTARQHSLHRLSLESCSRLTAGGISQLAQCQSLCWLSVNGLTCLTDDWLLQLATHCPRLTHLYLKFTKTISEQGLMQLAAFKRLRVLGVSGLGQFTNEVLYAVLENKQLELLEAVNCSQLKLTLENALVTIIS